MSGQSLDDSFVVHETIRIVIKDIKKYGKEKFLLTEVEFQLIESKFIEIKNGMLKCLGPQFVDESVQFSKQFTAVEIDKILGIASKAHHSLSTIK